MKTLERQLAEFGELHDQQWGPITADDVAITFVKGPVELVPAPPTRMRGWVYAAAAAAVVLLLALIPLWQSSGEEEPVVTSPEPPVTTIIESSGEPLQFDIEWTRIVVTDETWAAYDENGLGGVDEGSWADILLARGHRINYVDDQYRLYQDCSYTECLVWSSSDGSNWAYQGNEPPLDFFLSSTIGNGHPLYLEYTPRFLFPKDDVISAEMLVQPLAVRFYDGKQWQEAEYTLPIDVASVSENPLVWNIVTPSAHVASSPDHKMAFLVALGQANEVDTDFFVVSSVTEIDRFLVVYDGQTFETIPQPPGFEETIGPQESNRYYYWWGGDDLGWLGETLYWHDTPRNELWRFDGTEWVPMPVDGPLRNPQWIEFVGGRLFVADGFGEAWTSTDLTTWHKLHGPSWTELWQLQATEFGWMLADYSGAEAWISADGITWTPLDPSAELGGSDIENATYANGLFVISRNERETRRAAWIGRITDTNTD